MFGGAIDRAVDAADMCHLAGNVDQAARFVGRQQPFGHSLGQEVRAFDVQVRYRVEVRFGCFGGGCMAGQTGGIHQDFKRAIFCDCGGRGGNIGHIKRQRVGPHAICAHFGHGTIQHVFSARGQRDMGARFGQCHRASQTDA